MVLSPKVVRSILFLVVLAAAGPAAAQAVPGVPRNLAGTAAGALVTVTWQAPASGPAPTGYVLDVGPAPGTYTFGSLPLGLVTSFAFPAPPGTYYFRVRAENDAGSGPPTAEIAVTVGGGSALPSAPQNLTASAVGNVLTLTWNPPTQGAPITDYLLAVTGPGIAGRVSLGPSTSVTADAPSGAYTFAVSAVNAAGEGPPTAVVTLSVGNTVPPGVPTNFTAEVVGGNRIRLRWNPPVTGGPVRGYVLGAGTPQGAGRVPIGNVGSYEIAGVPDGTYAVTLAAENEAGEGPSTPLVTLLVGAGAVPGVPQGFSATTSGPLINLRWSEPATGAPITGYVLYAGGPGVGGGRLPLGLNTSFSATVPDGIYVVAVAALNALGEGPPTPLVTLTVANTTPPDTPLQLTGGGANNTLSLSWLAPSTGGPISRFRLQIGTAPGDYAFFDGATTSTSVATPVGSGTYFVRVRSENDAAVSAFTPEIAVTVGSACARPAAPVLSAMRTGNLVALSWTTPAGAPPIGYTLQLGSPTSDTFRSGALGAVNTISTTAPPGVYLVRVVGAASCGLGTPSNLVTVVVP